MDIGTAPTQEQRIIMIENEMMDPMEFHVAELNSFDWVYFRPWGVMPVLMGFHTVARATLLAFLHGYDCYIELARARGLTGYDSMSKLADAFLMEVPGTAFLSSQSYNPLAGKREHLNAQERAIFRKHGLEVRFLEDKI